MEETFILPERQSVLDLFHMTPYYWKTPKSGIEHLKAQDRRKVTEPFRIHVLERGD